MAEKASPASGGEFLLQLLRHPPRSQPPESPSHAAVIDDRRNQFEDAAIVEVGNGIAFSPPNLAAPGMMPPWLFPSPQPHHNTRSPPPGFHSRPEQRQQGGGSEGGYGRGSNLQNHHHHHRQQQQQQQQKKNFRDEATPTPTHLGFTTGVSDSAANFGSRDAKTDLSAFPGWGQVEVSRKMMVTEQDRRLANGKLADANWKTNHSRDHRGKGLLSPPVSNEWAGDASSAARRTTVDHGRSSKGTWNMQKDYPRVPNVEDFPKEDNPMILPSPYVNKPTMQKKFYQHTNLERAKHFVENGRNRASEPRADFLDDLHRTNIDQDFVSRGFSTFSLKQLPDSFTVVEEHPEKIEVQVNCSRSKDYRSDFSRGHNVSNQRRRINRGAMQCRRDIRNLSSSFCSIYGSLLPRKDESAKQMQLLSLLKKLVGKEWPDARLHLYGSCANSFGVTTSDIDICLAIDDTMTSKPEILLRLADILQTDNLQNVQALTRARVPIVKVMDPVSGISCDICINNLLAVENTKLLRDYAQIDSRLQQLVFLVKHWAKSRNVNETYQGTLSSYAYVLMCIHFLQQRRPAILPCLQKMEPTYVTTVDGVRCAYFDNVEKLQNFGSSNGENVAELLWGFFNYWAFQHDYTNDVISVRTGGIISKQSKDWTRRIGNDRHLICIEDPFETSHDLGRVVDKRSIRILREEFERAADLLQFDSNPCITLFEPYVR